MRIAWITAIAAVISLVALFAPFGHPVDEVAKLLFPKWVWLLLFVASSLATLALTLCCVASRGPHSIREATDSRTGKPLP